jgi:acetyl esterase
MNRALALSCLLAIASLPAMAQDRRPSHENVKYGPHERNVMDVWLAKSDKPTPVLVSIHGGGFAKGDKSVSPDLLRRCLDSGISVVAITYRFSNQAIAPAQFLDSARAIQFIRHKAKEWNLDPKRVAATGSSAGAGISLWLGFHDDLADPKSEDPVLRQSTRLTCMSVFNGQTSYDPRFIRDLLAGSDTYKHPRLAQLFAVDLDKLDDLPKEKYKLFELVSPINHVTKEDPPAQLLYAANFDAPIKNQGVGIHHPKFGQVLKERMDKLGIECQLQARVRAADSAELTFGFIKKHFEQKPKLGEKFLPRDIDLARPIYETSFESADVLKEWRLEGGKQMSIADGRLILESDPAKKGKDGKCIDHLVCWLLKELPADFLIEFTVRPTNRKEGLNIVFFSTRGLKGESIFDPNLKPRDGTYKQYHSGELNGYHISYWAAGRGTANLRKSKGFHLVAEGKDLICDAPAHVFQTVRVYKRGGTIRLTIDDVVALAWEDDGKLQGPASDQPGWFGLRQMGHTHRCEYGHVKVYRLKRD